MDGDHNLNMNHENNDQNEQLKQNQDQYQDFDLKIEQNVIKEDEISLGSVDNDIYAESIFVDGEESFTDNWDKNTIEKKLENTRLFLRPLKDDINSEDIQKIFELRGFKVIDAYIPLRKGKSKGYGFVGFESIEDAQRALDLKKIEYKGQEILIANATGKEHSKYDENPTNILFLRNLPNDVTVEEIKNHFIESKEVRLMNNGICRGIAFVEFSNIEQAKQFKEISQNLIIKGRRIGVEFGNPRKDKNFKTQINRSNYFKNNQNFDSYNYFPSSSYRRRYSRSPVRENYKRRNNTFDGFYSIPSHNFYHSNEPYFSHRDYYDYHRNDYNNDYNNDYHNDYYNDYHNDYYNDYHRNDYYIKPQFINDSYRNKPNNYLGHMNPYISKNSRNFRYDNYYNRPR